LGKAKGIPDCDFINKGLKHCQIYRELG